MTAKNKNRPQPLGSLLADYKDKLAKRKKYIKTEHQAYGLMLAEELGDWNKRALYIRLAKTNPRSRLEKARYFVQDQNRGKIKSKARLFMWKLKELKKETQNSVKSSECEK